jgi:hypothetical protein
MTTEVNVIKLFYFVTDEETKEARVVVLGMPCICIAMKQNTLA